jgi:hypothetical protein
MPEQGPSPPLLATWGLKGGRLDCSFFIAHPKAAERGSGTPWLPWSARSICTARGGQLVPRFQSETRHS